MSCSFVLACEMRTISCNNLDQLLKALVDGRLNILTIIFIRFYEKPYFEVDNLALKIQENFAKLLRP